MIASRQIPVINRSNINGGSSGTTEGDVSTVKLEPLSVGFETVASSVEPKVVVD